VDVSGQIHTLATLPRGINSRYPLSRRVSELQCQYGRFVGKEKSLAYASNRTMVPLLSGTWPSHDTLSRCLQLGIGNTRSIRLRQVGRGLHSALVACLS